MQRILINFACGVEILREGWERHFGAAGGPFRDIAQIGILSIFRVLTPVSPHCVLYPEIPRFLLLAFLYCSIYLRPSPSCDNGTE